jgi:putative transposase
MKQKRYTPEQIITILREVDAGKGIQDVCRVNNISPQSYHRWRKKYGRMELRDAKRLKELERENTQLKKIVAEQMLENRVLKEVNAKKW